MSEAEDAIMILMGTRRKDSEKLLEKQAKEADEKATRCKANYKPYLGDHGLPCKNQKKYGDYCGIHRPGAREINRKKSLAARKRNKIEKKKRRAEFLETIKEGEKLLEKQAKEAAEKAEREPRCKASYGYSSLRSYKNLTPCHNQAKYDGFCEMHVDKAKYTRRCQLAVALLDINLIITAHQNIKKAAAIFKEEPAQ